MLPIHSKKMGLDVRNTGRCPNLILITLSLFALFTFISWWSASSQNIELLRQINDMAIQIKESSDKLDKCAIAQMKAQERVRETEARVAEVQVQLDRSKTVQDDLNEGLRKAETHFNAAENKVKGLKNSLTLCTSELESLKKLGEAKNKTLETLRAEIKSLSSQIDKKNEEGKKFAQLDNKNKEETEGKDNHDGVNGVGVVINSNHEVASVQDAKRALDEKASDNDQRQLPKPEEVEDNENLRHA